MAKVLRDIVKEKKEEKKLKSNASDLAHCCQVLVSLKVGFTFDLRVSAATIIDIEVKLMHEEAH